MEQILSTININVSQLTPYAAITAKLALIALVGVIIFIVIQRGLKSLVRRRILAAALAGGLRILFRWLIIALVILVGLQQLGIHMAALWAALSAVAVFVGVGLIAVWSVVSNALCSLLLLIFQPFRVGDRIEIIEPTGGSGLRGEVVDLSLMFTFLEEEQGDGNQGTVVYVPNNIFFQKTIRRWRRLNSKRLDEYMFNQKSREPVKSSHF